MTGELQRPDPDVLLAQLNAAEEARGGKLRIWLGAAPGVGKSVAMLQEGQRRQSRGSDVVVGLVEDHGRDYVRQHMAGLEIVPPLPISYAGKVHRELDTAAVLARRPTVALVDDLEHSNVPGSKHPKRYQDIEELLDAGINVVTTLNVAHLESLSEYVAGVAAIDVGETVPDHIVDGAEQVELIDLPPEVLIQRMEDGLIFPPEEARRALDSYFTLSTLTMLRDLALRATAKEVEEKLDSYLHARKLEGRMVGERIMVAVDHRTAGTALIRRGWRLAAALKGECTVVNVQPVEARRKPQSASDEQQLAANLQLAEELGAEVVRLHGKVADTLIGYARAHHVSQLFIGHPSHTRWEEFLHGSVTNSVLRNASGISVHVIGDAASFIAPAGRNNPRAHGG